MVTPLPSGKHWLLVALLLLLILVLVRPPGHPSQNRPTAGPPAPAATDTSPTVPTFYKAADSLAALPEQP